MMTEAVRVALVTIIITFFILKNNCGMMCSKRAYIRLTFSAIGMSITVFEVFVFFLK